MMRLCRRFLFSVFACLLALSVSSHVWANDHGGGGGPEPLKFTVNLGKTKYLQVEMVLVGASPEVEHELAALRPRLMHEIILLLSEQLPEKLVTREGKHLLMADVIEAANHVIHENEKTGVKEVLFTSFIIQ